MTFRPRRLFLLLCLAALLLGAYALGKRQGVAQPPQAIKESVEMRPYVRHGEFLIPKEEWEWERVEGEKHPPADGLR